MGNGKTSRRKFLSQAGYAVAGTAFAKGPILALFDAITEGAIRRAYAQELGITPRRWLDLQFPSAPPRWTYDLFLKVWDEDMSSATSKFVGGNKQVATRYTEANGKYTGTQFVVSSEKINGIHVPYLWKFDVPSSNGQTRPMSQLLERLLNIRSIHAGNDGHSGAAALHFNPLGATTSLPAMVADHSTRSIPAINTGAYMYSFKSNAGKSYMSLTEVKLFNNLLNPFRPSTNITVFQGREKLVPSYIEAVRASLESSAIARNGNAKIAQEAVKGARDLMSKVMQNFYGDLDTQWNELTQKYADLVYRAIRGTYEGINDKYIGIEGYRDATYRISLTDVVNGDLRDIIREDTIHPGLVRGFALAEFIIKNNLSDSITIGIGGLVNVYNGDKKLDKWVTDEHHIGCMPSLLVNSLHSFATSACLLELMDCIGTGMDETIINVSSEFNRAARHDGSGSDHGPQGASVAIYSGIIDGPIILGNLAPNAFPTNYAGTWGAGAIQPELGRQFDRGDVAATYAALLRVPSPVTARSSLINVSGKSITLNVPQGKIV